MFKEDQFRALFWVIQGVSREPSEDKRVSREPSEDKRVSREPSKYILDYACFFTVESVFESAARMFAENVHVSSRNPRRQTWGKLAVQGFLRGKYP
jgi:hypothetical protein